MTDDLGLSVTIDARMERFEASMERAARLAEDVTRRIDAATARSADALARLDAAAAPAARALAQMEQATAPATRALAQIDPAIQAATGGMSRFATAAAEVGRSSAAMATQVLTTDRAWTALELTVGTAQGGLRGLRRELAENVVEASLFGDAADRASSAWTRLEIVAGAVGVGLSARGLLEQAQEYHQAVSLIERAAGDQAAYVERQLYGIAQAAGASFTEMATLTKSLEGLPGGMREATQVVEAVARSMATMPGSAQASAAAITQFTQAMQLGVLRGQDFKSVMSQAPGLAEALADGLNVTAGEMRAMAEAGELSAQRVSAALRSVLPDLTALNEQIGLSLSQQIQGVDNALGRFAGAVDARAGSSAAIGSTLGDVTERLESIEAQNAAVAVMDRFAVAGGMASDAMMFLADNIGLVIGAWAAWSAMKAVGGAVLFRGALTTAGTAMSALGISTQTTLGRIGQFTAAATFSVSPLSIITGLLSAGAAGWFLWESRITDAQRATEAYHEAVSSLDDMLSKHGGTLETLADKYATVEEAQRDTLTKELEKEIEGLEAAAEKAYDAVYQAFRGARRQATTVWAGDGPESSLGSSIDYMLRQFEKTGDIDAFIARVGSLQEELDELGTGAAKRLAEALEEVSVSTIGTARKVEGLNDEIEDLNSLLAYMQGEISHAEFLQRLADGAETAASAVLKLEQQIWAVGATFAGLAQRDAEGAWNAEIANLERLTQAYRTKDEAVVDGELRRQAVDKAAAQRLDELVKLRGILAGDEASYALAAADALDDAEALVAARWDNKAGADAYREALSKLHQGQKDNNQALEGALSLLDEHAQRSMPAAMQAEQRYNAVIDEAIASGRVQIDVIDALIAARDEHVGAIQAEADAELARLTDAPGLIEEETAAILAGGDALERLNQAREIATARADQYSAVLEQAREAGLSETEAIQVATKSADALAKAMEGQDIAQAVERQREGVRRVAERIGMDISESIVTMANDGLTDGMDSLIDVFSQLHRSIQAELLNQTLIMPITTAMVGGMPGLFGVPSAAPAGGVPSGHQVATNNAGQMVYVQQGQPPPVGFTMAAMPSPAMIPGMEDVFGIGGFLGSTAFTLPETFGTTMSPGFIGLDGAMVEGGIPVSYGNLLGAGMYGLSGAMGLASGQYISGTTSLIAGGMTLIPGPWTPFAPLVAMGGGLLEGIFGGIFGGGSRPHPSAGGLVRVESDGTVSVPDYFGKHTTLEEQMAAVDPFAAFVQSIMDLTDATLVDGLEMGLDANDGEWRLTTPHTRVPKDLQPWVSSINEGEFIDFTTMEAAQSAYLRALGIAIDDMPEVSRVLQDVTPDNIETVLPDISFVQTFDQAVETMTAGVVNFAETARGQMVDGLGASRDAIEDFLETTERLLPERMAEAEEAIRAAGLAMFGLTEESEALAPEIQSFIGQMQGLQDEFADVMGAAGWTQDNIGEAGFASLAEAENEAIRRAVGDWLETVALTQDGADALEEAFGDIPGILDLLTAEVEQSREDLKRQYDQRYANAMGDTSWLGIPDFVDAYDDALDAAADVGLDAAIVTRTYMAEIADAAKGLDQASLQDLMAEFSEFEVVVDGLELAMRRGRDAARQAAQALEADWETRLIQATRGDTLEGQLDLFDRRAQQDWIDAAANGYADMALLEETLAAERLAIIEQFGQQSVATLEAMANTARSTGENVRTYLNALMGQGGPAGLSPLDAYESSSDLFASALGTISNSDDEEAVRYALGQITTLAQQMLEASEAYHGQTTAYGADRAFVIGALDALADTLGVSAFDPDADTAALLEQIREAAGVTAPSTIADEISAHFTEVFGGAGAESYLGQLVRAQAEAAALSAEISANTADTAMTAEEIRALIEAARNDNGWLDTRDWGGSPAANYALAQATGYQGDFGSGGFDAWVADQDRATQMEAAQILLDHGQSSRIGWAGAAPHLTDDLPAHYQAANDAIRAATGYAGLFGGGAHWDWLQAQDEAIKALTFSIFDAFGQSERVRFASGDSDDRQWAAPGSEHNIAVNRILAQATGYQGDFGSGGFDAWIVDQDRATQMDAAWAFIDHGQSSRIGWAGAAPHLTGDLPAHYQAANDAIRAATGYAGLFGGGAHWDWLQAQDEAIKALTFSIFDAFGQSERVFATGGWVHGPGGPTDDLISARLSAGEFVVNAASAQRWGPTLEAINDNRLPALSVPAPPRAIDFAPVVGKLDDLIRESQRQTARIEKLERVLVAHGLQLEDAVRDGQPVAEQSQKHLKKIAGAMAR